MPRTKKAMRQPRWTAHNNQLRPDGAPYEAPAALAVDPVVLTVLESQLSVLVVADADGTTTLPGGLVTPAESADATVARCLGEKTGLQGVRLEQLHAFTEPGRDYRGWIPSIAYLGLMPSPTEGALPAGARWVDAHDPPALDYDHNDIVGLAVQRIQRMLWWSNIAVGILPGAFTASEARTVYDAVLGTVHNERTFLRDLQATALITDEPVGMRHQAVGRPAALYRFVSTETAWAKQRRKGSSREAHTG